MRKLWCLVVQAELRESHHVFRLRGRQPGLPGQGSSWQPNRQHSAHFNFILITSQKPCWLFFFFETCSTKVMVNIPLLRISTVGGCGALLWGTASAGWLDVTQWAPFSRAFGVLYSYFPGRTPTPGIAPRSVAGDSSCQAWIALCLPYLFKLLFSGTWKFSVCPPSTCLLQIPTEASYCGSNFNSCVLGNKSSWS